MKSNRAWNGALNGMMIRAAGLAAGLWMGGAALAQDAAPKEQPAAVEAQPALEGRAMTWSDPEFQKLAGMLTGTWKTTEAVAGDGGSSHVIIGIAPVALKDVPDALYCEAAREDGLRMPYRQVILSFKRVGGKVRIVSHEFRATRGVYPPAYTMWAAPEAFPEVGANHLVATMMYEVTPTTDGFSGATPHPYPTSRGGAAELSSEIKAAGGQLWLADRGTDGAGKVVWGPAAGSWTKFAKVDSPVKVDRRESGLLSITYPGALEGKAAAGNDEVQCHYIGYLYDGKVFDTSHDRRAAFRYPFSNKLIDGWTEQMTDTQKGLVRRLVIPAAKGYGAGGRGRVIPPNATLIMDVEVLSVTEAPPPPPPVAVPQPGAAPGGEPAKPQ